MTERKPFILTMDLTPKFMSGYALRKHLSEYRWRKIIKKELVSARGLTCEICPFSANEPKHIDAHEVFEYLADDTVRIADIQLLCTRCHDIKDFAQTERLIAQGESQSRVPLGIGTPMTEVSTVAILVVVGTGGKRRRASCTQGSW